VTLGDLAPIEQEILIASARRVLAGRGEQVVGHRGDTVILISEEHSAIAVRRKGEDKAKARLEELSVLSPDKVRRAQALDRILQTVGPTAGESLALREVIRNRELTDDEVASLLEEFANGVTAIQRRSATSIHGGRSRLNDLVPESLRYFEHFCGPALPEIPLEEYLSSVLPRYRAQLIDADLVQGLKICLLGALREDLSPTQWVRARSDDEVWKALEICEPRKDPYSLLGALDLALTRQQDARFRLFAEEAVRTLTAERFPGPGGVDSYDLLPVLAQIVFDRLCVIEGGAAQAPFWRRMCAWMQAGFLIRILRPMNVEIDSLRRWADEHRQAASIVARFVDLRSEPMARASEMVPAGLRAEIIGRLHNLRARENKEGRVMPRVQEIDSAMARLREQGKPLDWAMPGPLEGRRRAGTPAPMTLSGPDAEELARDLERDPSGPAWSALAYLAQCYHLDESLLGKLRSIASQIKMLNQEEDRRKQLARLVDGCLAAAAERDSSVASSIVGAIRQSWGHISSAEEVFDTVTLILVAGAAFADEASWVSWVDTQLSELAARVRPGPAAAAVVDLIHALKQVLPVRAHVGSRAEALAIASS